MMKLNVSNKFWILLPVFTLFLFCSGYAQDNVPASPEDISPLLIGEKAPDLPLTDLENHEIKLTDIISAKPTVLIFYRGGWCPYCNAQLGDLNDIEDEVTKLGYQIIAVSPDNPEHLQGSVDKHELKYKLYSDKELGLAREFGIVFQASERLTKRLEEFSGGDNQGWLPVPSVFVLNQEGEILFEYINPNYKVRISSNLLLGVLKALNSQ